MKPLKIYKVFIPFIFLLCLLSLTNCMCARPTDGEKVGRIVKVAQEGFVRKTWEAQLIRGGTTDGSGSIGGAPFNFTINNADILKMAQEAMRQNREVVVHYTMPLIAAAGTRERSSQGVAVAIELIRE